MLKVLVSSISPRLMYTMDLVFREMLGLSIEIIERESDITSESWVIDYRLEDRQDLGCRIPNIGLLYENHIREVWAEASVCEIPYLFPVRESVLDFDPFSAIFYLATDYEKYVASHLDQHGRYDQLVYPSGKEGWLAQPLCELYAEKLWEYLLSYFPELSREEKASKTFWTFDLDNPWKHQHKPWYVQIGGLAKDLLQLNWDQVKERIGVWAGASDPNEVYKLLEDTFPTGDTRYFILLERTSPHDTRFTWKSTQLKELVKKLYQNGSQVGIHPSYHSYKDAAQLGFEKVKLEEWVGKVHMGRQHFLKVSYPETYRAYIASDIQTDFSACLYHMTGFPMGMMRSFYWFDLENNQQTPLRIQPTQIMDVSLKGYMALSPVEAVEEMDRIFSLIQQYGGELCVLLHNEALSESGEWKGWREPILGWVNKVNQA